MSQLVKNPPSYHPWVGKIPWRRERLPTPGFWPGEIHRLYSPWGRKESDTTERLSLSLYQRYTLFFKNFILHLGTANEQCCDGVRWTAKGLSHTCTCIHPPQTPVLTRRFKTPHNTEQSSMCYTGSPCCLRISNIAVCTCSS